MSDDNKFPDHIKKAAPFIDGLIKYAVLCGASDIHIDPRKEDILVRLRIDGLMNISGTISKSIHDELISRLKILSNTRTDLHAIPQDGRWQATVNDKQFNIRISFMPTYHGENAVMRLLPTITGRPDSLLGLGFTFENIRAIKESLKKTSGLILVTGPTGAGKTTTLHSCLSIKAKEELSVISLEDPVEYEIPGVRQIHIRQSHGVSFASGLRSALRQDPDVIMVGEIRDAETANVAVHTALTGHLVLSTLHTNSAIESIPRLIDMGVDPYLLAATLRLIIAQNLGRKLCEVCFDGKTLSDLGEDQICHVCRGSGYFGRTVIAEVCPIDRDFQKLITERRSISDILDFAISRGFRSIKEDGEEKIEWGITSREELIRVTQK